MMNTCRCGPLMSNFRGCMAGRASLTGLAGFALVLLPFLLDMTAQLQSSCWMLSGLGERIGAVGRAVGWSEWLSGRASGKCVRL